MERDNKTSSENPGREVLITRIYDAPRELVFKAWSDKEHLSHWYAPRGCTVVFYNHDFRKGGTFLCSIQNPMSHDCVCIGIYREIAEPEKIVYSLFFADKAGNFIEPLQAGMDADWPRETIVTVTFAEYEGKTKLTLHQTVPESIAKRTGAYPSWIDMLDRLAGLLSKEPAFF